MKGPSYDYESDICDIKVLFPLVHNFDEFNGCQSDPIILKENLMF
jgi:hypothetical protein